MKKGYKLGKVLLDLIQSSGSKQAEIISLHPLILNYCFTLATLED